MSSGNETTRRILLLLVLGCVLFAGCSRRQLGLPRVHLEVASPDGERLALVLNHPAIDPPSQSLWLHLADGRKIELRRLAEDQDWCDTVVWSRDGSTVAFLVQDARLVVADAASGQVVLDRWLVDLRGGYPGRESVRDLELSGDGSVATYRRCPLRGGACSEPDTMPIGERRGKQTA